MQLKQLNEKRGALVTEATKIKAEAKTESGEVRALNSDELNKLKGIHSEIENLDENIQVEARQLSILSKSSPSLSRQEQRDVNTFDLGKILRNLNQGGSGRPLDGIEAEMVIEGEREARAAGISVSGIPLPKMLLVGKETRAAMVAGTDANGGELIETTKRGLLGDFYNSSVLEQAGAMVLNGLMGNVDLPRYTKGTDPVKKAENAAAGEAGGTFASLSLTPKRLPAYIDISDQLLLQSSSILEAFIGGELRRQLNSVKEVAFFHGGGTLEPTGIAETAGIGSVVGGTDGAAPTYAHLVDLWKQVAGDNADLGALSYFMNTATIGKLLQTPKVASTDSVMVLNDLAAGFLGRPVRGSNAISSTLTKGSSSGVASAIFYGNANDFVVGYWGGLMIEMVRDTTGAKAGQRTLVANTYYDAGVLRPQSFAAMLDALSA
jgi:HK97 family phage major capsid protein